MPHLVHAGNLELRGFAKLASQLKKKEQDPAKKCQEIEDYAMQIFQAYDTDDDSGSVYACLGTFGRLL